MVGQAALANPELAKEIVKRGHEAAAHAGVWFARKDEIADWTLKNNIQS
jgi:peptidoglycan/xylan/chitin deacetylase (PgdA/CDA1 family)